MSAMQLETKRVEKPWGRTRLGAGFPDLAPGAPPIGEIWFADPPGNPLPLMVKYLFTSERLSIQVHPDDEQAQARGHAHGKEECWIILDAQPGATLGLGLKHAVSSEHLRQAALDGSIEALMDWRPVSSGDVVYLPAGTIHAIGAGITLVEVQQNIDLTYRLYDYGRPRELHLDDGIAVSRPEPYAPPDESDWKFVLKGCAVNGTCTIIPSERQRLWCVTVSGNGAIDGERFAPGQCWLAREPIQVEAQAADLLVASPGPLEVLAA